MDFSESIVSKSSTTATHKIPFLVPLIILLSSSMIWLSPWTPSVTSGRYNIPGLAVWIPMLAAVMWLGSVVVFVPEPYLDEVFHIPQAQKYCEGRLREWDNKITTPPGLYLVSYIFHVIPQWVLSSPRTPCSEGELRALNAIAIAFISVLAAICRVEIEARGNNACGGARPPHSLSTYALHTGINIALFPVLFFFSALYYTDVVSTAAVLLAFKHQLGRLGRQDQSPRGRAISDILTVVLGLFALLMRQTNIFWVVVFNVGLEVVDTVKALRPSPANGNVQPMTASGQLGQVLAQYSVGHIHDPKLNDAYLDDLLVSGLSVGIAAICNPAPILRRVWPHLTLLGLFGGFVMWNGSVVLGDKSNHMATIHLPQMLYIWPFFAFFGAPLALPFLPQLIKSPLDTLSFSPVSGCTAPKSATSDGKDHPVAPKIETWLGRICTAKAYRPLVAMGILVVFALIVRYNTIVHPFTLADNRHYMFYIFRYAIRRSSAARQLLVIPYALCMVVSWSIISGFGRKHAPKTTQQFVDHPFAPPPMAVNAKDLKGEEKHAITLLNEPMCQAAEPTTVSTATLLVTATALSLITAPLVEPRYFIIPWVMFRLFVPAWKQTGRPAPTHHGDEALSAWARISGVTTNLTKSHDMRLLVETVWYLVINAATMYVFIRWPYVWRTEDGTVLDGGKLQRFMW